MTSISVVIPTKNAGSEFRERLEKIYMQNVSDIEIIIIDSGSTDGTVETAEDFADEIIKTEPDKFHHGKTRNLGAEKSTGEIIVFTVQDATPVNQEWLSNLVSPILDGVADVTYGNQVAYPEAKPPDKFFYKYLYPDNSIKLSEKNTESKSEFYLDNIFLSDVCSAISRDVWNNFQFRDSVAMSEDKDFAYRVASEGYTINYCPDAKVFHSHNYSFRSLFRRRYKDGKAFSKIAEQSPDTFVSKGMAYILNEYKYLIQNGKIEWIPYTVLYDAIYFLAFTLGEYHTYIPEWADKRLG